MELQTIQTTTTWNDAAGRINTNNAKVSTELEKLGNATYKHKGYFKTLDDLETAYPTSFLGAVAWVGTQYPFTLYRWIMRTGWTTDGTTGGDENLDLSQYYTKEEAKAMFVQSDGVRSINASYTQEQLEAMEAEGLLEEGVLYLGFEQ
jgi:hypothetical protein